MQTSLHRLLELEAGDQPVSAQEERDYQLYLARLAAEPGRLSTDWLNADVAEAQVPPATESHQPEPERPAAGPAGQSRFGGRSKARAMRAVIATAIGWAVTTAGLGLEIFHLVEQGKTDRKNAQAELAQAAKREEAERQTAEREATIARRERLLKEQVEKQRDAKADAVRDLIGQAEAVAPLGKGNGPGRPVFDRALHYLSEIAAEAQRDPTRAGEAAELYRRVGNLLSRLGDLGNAETNYNTALRLAELARESDDTPTCQHRLAMILREWGATQVQSEPMMELQFTDEDGNKNTGPRIIGNKERSKKAKAAWDRSLAILEPVANVTPEYRFTLAQLRMVRGNLAAMAEGRLADARQEYVAAERLIEGLLRESPSDRRYRFLRAQILNNRAYVVGGDTAKWESDCELAVDIYRKLMEEEKDRPDYKAFFAASLNHYGRTLEAKGPSHYATAEATYKDAQVIYKALILAFPGVKSNVAELKQVEANLRRLADKK